jgi:molybdopterin-binding protein
VLISIARQKYLENYEETKVTAKVKIEIDTPVVVTALISGEAVEELDVKAGPRGSRD